MPMFVAAFEMYYETMLEGDLLCCLEVHHFLTYRIFKMSCTALAYNK